MPIVEATERPMPGGTESSACVGWPRSARICLIAAVTVLLCSCQAAGPSIGRRAERSNRPTLFASAPNPPASRGVETASVAIRRPTASTPRQAVQQVAYHQEPYRSGPLQPPPDGAGCIACDEDRGFGNMCLACQVPSAAPRGPRFDELLCDGGDFQPSVGVRRDGSLIGLDPEDTIAEYATVDGRIVVEPSNKVCLYAPRFGAVRRIVRTVEQESSLPVLGTLNVERSVLSTEDQSPGLTAARLSPRLDSGELPPSVYRTRQQGGDLVARRSVLAMQDAISPYADFNVIRFGMVDNGEKPRLAERIVAAVTWAHDLGVQVAIKDQSAQLMDSARSLEMVFRIDEPDEPRIRIYKLASRRTAQPGETVEFTLRFDNVGDQKIDGVTIVDHLTTRLEYVPDSQATTIPAEFSTEQSGRGSLVLRWDIQQPLAAGEGGVIRFTCRVR